MGILYRKGIAVRRVKEADMLDALLEEIELCGRSIRSGGGGKA